MKIYVASSWKNARQPQVVKALREAGHNVYDFRHPEPHYGGFHWSDIDPEWKQWSMQQLQQALHHPVAIKGFKADLAALNVADAVVLVAPCGRSSHLELGYAIGRGIPSAILLSDGEPELMYAMADKLCVNVNEIIEWLQTQEQ